MFFESRNHSIYRLSFCDIFLDSSNTGFPAPPSDKASLLYSTPNSAKKIQLLIIQKFKLYHYQVLFVMSDYNDEKKPENAVNRRCFLKSVSVAAGAVSFGSISSTSVEGKETSKANREVQELPVEAEQTQKKLREFTGPLLKALVSEGYVSQRPVQEFPTHPLSDETQPGGVERLQVDGEYEQFLFHKHVEGGRLEVNIAENSEPMATFYAKDSSKTITYDLENNYDGDVSTEGCNTYACDCLLDFTCYSEKFACWEDCPNCVIGDCHRVKKGCC